MICRNGRDEFRSCSSCFRHQFLGRSLVIAFDRSRRCVAVSPSASFECVETMMAELEISEGTPKAIQQQQMANEGLDAVCSRLKLSRDG